MSYLSSLLNATHSKSDFDCGIEALNYYLHTQAKQDVKRKLSACFVFTEGNKVAGYYTLSNASIPKQLIPRDIANKFPPSYHDLPVTLLGRLAIDILCKGRGLGERLLIDALKRSYDITDSIGSMAVVVDPIDTNATKFYDKYGFLHLDNGKMFIAMKTIEYLFVGR